MEIILEDLDVEARRKAEHAVADVAEAVMQLEKEGDFGNALGPLLVWLPPASSFYFALLS